MRVAFDMDGTLADNSAREHLARAAAGTFGSKTEKSEAWEKFHAGIPDDPPIMPVLITLRALFFAGHHVEIWTARPEKYRAVTERWCDRWNVPHVLPMRMRPEGEWCRSPELKCRWFEQTPVDLVFEDHPETTAALRMRGCVVAQVGSQTGV